MTHLRTDPVPDPVKVGWPVKQVFNRLDLSIGQTRLLYLDLSGVNESGKLVG
jgi:hypothetical protein